MAFWSQFLAAHAEVCALDDGGGVRVRLTGPRAEVRIPVSAPVEEEVRRAWEAEIARALSLEVTLTLEAVPASHPEDVLKIAQSALRRWVAPDDVRLVDGELLVTFSGPGAYALFQSHGGAAWVAQTYPTLPRLAVEVRPEEPLPPEEAVVLPDASDDPVRIGRGPRRRRRFRWPTCRTRARWSWPGASFRSSGEAPNAAGKSCWPD